MDQREMMEVMGWWEGKAGGGVGEGREWKRRELRGEERRGRIGGEGSEGRVGRKGKEGR